MAHYSMDFDLRPIMIGQTFGVAYWAKDYDVGELAKLCHKSNQVNLYIYILRDLGQHWSNYRVQQTEVSLLTTLMG